MSKPPQRPEEALLARQIRRKAVSKPWQTGGRWISLGQGFKQGGAAIQKTGRGEFLVVGGQASGRQIAGSILLVFLLLPPRSKREDRQHRADDHVVSDHESGERVLGPKFDIVQLEFRQPSWRPRHMKTASGSPGFKLPGEPGTTRMAQHRLVEGTTDALADPPGNRHQFERASQRGRGPVPGGAAEEWSDGQIEEHPHWKCTVIVSKLKENLNDSLQLEVTQIVIVGTDVGWTFVYITRNEIQSWKIMDDK